VVLPYLAVGDPFKVEVIFLASWERENTYLGLVAPEGLGGAGNMPSL
jgi:hypothetical protein